MATFGMGMAWGWDGDINRAEGDSMGTLVGLVGTEWGWDGDVDGDGTGRRQGHEWGCRGRVGDLRGWQRGWDGDSMGTLWDGMGSLWEHCGDGDTIGTPIGLGGGGGMNGTKRDRNGTIWR